MTGKSQSIINAIKSKVQNPMTGARFTNNDQIIELALESFVERLKKEKLM